MIEIYALVDPRTGAIRYVGQSKDARDRYRRHLREAQSGRHSHKIHWIQQLSASDLQPALRILETVEEKDADSAEIKWIAWLRPQLTNVADGGGGTRGVVFPPKTDKFRAAVSESNRTRPPMGAQGRANVAAANRRRKGSKAPRPSPLRGQTLSAETIQQMRNAKRARYQCSECGLESTAAGLHSHQRNKGHQGKTHATV